MIQTPKALTALGLVALISVAGNAALLFQVGRLHNRAVTTADAREAQVRAELAQADADLLRLYNATAALVTGWLVQDRASLMADLAKVADRARGRDVRWVERDVPEPACGPGQEFVDATNELIGSAR